MASYWPVFEAPHLGHLFNSSTIRNAWPSNTLQAFKDFAVIKASSAMQAKPAANPQWLNFAPVAKFCTAA